jgi:hypothetical protein
MSHGVRWRSLSSVLSASRSRNDQMKAGPSTGGPAFSFDPLDGVSYTVRVNIRIGQWHDSLRCACLGHDHRSGRNPLGGLPFSSGQSYTIIKTATYNDVPTSYWAWIFVERLSNAGITGGCGSGNYCPETSVTRAQMGVFLLRSKYGASCVPPVVGGSTGFTDVPPTYWAVPGLSNWWQRASQLAVEAVPIVPSLLSRGHKWRSSWCGRSICLKHI